MPEQFTLAPTLELDELHSYHQDVVGSLRLYFNPSTPTFAARFVGKRLDEVNHELALRIKETEDRSAFFVLTRLEASFKIDFHFRCKKRLKDELSKCFREAARGGRKVRLDDILEGWRRHRPEWSREISELRGAFSFRHWLAHGRYGTPSLGRQKYDFAYVHLMAESIISGFGLAG